MSADQEERTRIAADLLQCKPEEVQQKVRGMSSGGRRYLTTRIDGVIAWLADYEAAEAFRMASMPQPPTAPYN